jgi:hypothetical protein
VDAAKKFHTSVVMGHTHRLGIVSHSFGFGGEIAKTVSADGGRQPHEHEVGFLPQGWNWHHCNG